MQLVIAEKPSVARDIAHVLGARKTTSATQGYIETPDYVVSWAIGHLVGLAEADHYNLGLKRWRTEDLPILPQTFELKVLPKTSKQFSILKSLLLEADTVINACDAGREGELIFRYILQMSRYKGKVLRLWLSSLTTEAIRDAFTHLQSSSRYDRLYEGARCRAESDWLIGINATRALTCRFGGLLTSGRVQTPTLALIVAREAEIERFVPATYYEVMAHFSTTAGNYDGIWQSQKLETTADRTLLRPALLNADESEIVEDESHVGNGGNVVADTRQSEESEHESIGSRITEKSDALDIAERVRGKAGIIQSVQKERQLELPPRLFDLTSLQRTANRLFGFTAKRTLDRLQTLYEKHKAITYPRTDSAYLSTDIVGTLAARLQAICAQPFAESIVAMIDTPLATHKRFIDDSKVTDHHAIVPTEKRPSMTSWNEDERKLYELISRRFLAAFFPAAEWERTTLKTVVAGETFLTRGRVLRHSGWRVTQPQEEKKSQTDLLPPVVEGMPTQTKKVEVKEKQTQPPKRYTEATLLRAMETCGKNTDFAEVMKERGLGTPSTRAGTIEKLKDVGYIATQGKQLVPTNKGRDLIRAIPVAALTSAELTGEWENALRQIELGERQPSDFMQQIRRYATHIVEAVRVAEGVISVGDSPPPKRVAKKNRATKTRVGGTSRAKKGNAEKAISPAWPPCPQCGGAIVERPTFWGCSGWTAGCPLKIWKTISGRAIMVEEAQTLLRAGETTAITFISPRTGRPFEARLHLKEGVARLAFDERGHP